MDRGAVMTVKRPNTFSTPAEAFRAGVAIVGSQPKVAALVGKSQATVSRRLRDGREIWPESVPVFAEATGIPRSALRPDLYDPADAEAGPADRFEPAR